MGTKSALSRFGLRWDSWHGRGLPSIYAICSVLFVMTKKSTNALTRFAPKPVIEIIRLSNGVVAQMKRQLVKLKQIYR